MQGNLFKRKLEINILLNCTPYLVSYKIKIIEKLTKAIMSVLPLIFTLWHSSKNHVPDSKVHGANMGPTWVLSAPDGPHVGPMNLAIRDSLYQPIEAGWCMYASVKWVSIDSGNILSHLWHQASYYLDQWWLIDNCVLRNKFHWNLLRDLKI